MTPHRPTTREARCAACGRPAHRYSTNDPPRKWDPQACINGLRSDLDRMAEVLNEALDQLELFGMFKPAARALLLEMGYEE